ncbi:MAG: OmpA family protein [Proteobacteria bacterium]|nr:OmpA family protein [Pseudomonadota bacterium]
MSDSTPAGQLAAAPPAPSRAEMDSVAKAADGDKTATAQQAGRGGASASADDSRPATAAKPAATAEPAAAPDESEPDLASPPNQASADDTRPPPQTDQAFVAERRFPASFAVGSARPVYIKRKKLSQLVKQLDACPGRIVVKGHADSTGDPRENLELSRERAAAVGDLLADKYNLDVQRIDVRGLGDSEPANPNTNLAGRKANRRVTVRCGSAN